MAPVGLLGGALRLQKICTLGVHDENYSKDDVLFNAEKFQELGIPIGSLAQVVPLKSGIAVRDFQSPVRGSSTDKSKNESNKDSQAKSSKTVQNDKLSEPAIIFDEKGSRVQNSNRDVDDEKSYIFVTKELSPEIRQRHPMLQVSFAKPIADAFGFRPGTQAILCAASEDLHAASHVELSFRDEYLARADMWRMARGELIYKTVYRGQKLLFMGSIKAAVKSVYINGRAVHSAYFSSTTKPIFRSESARYVLFIQMSKEMWEFDSDGSGETMFSKVINGFLPELFKRWMSIHAHHLVTIVLFTRIEYEGETKPPEGSLPELGQAAKTDDNPRPTFRDFYRVVVNEMASGDWVSILYQLKKEFKVFLRDVSLIPIPPSPANGIVIPDQAELSKDQRFVIAGSPSSAARGNILEAINLAASQFATDYIDRDLVRTGISVIVITPGTGSFEVEYNMLKMTTDNLIGSGIGIDLVCLSRMPLHSVPLFKYRNPRLVTDESRVEDRGGESTPRQRAADFGGRLNLPSKVSPPSFSGHSIVSPSERPIRSASPTIPGQNSFSSNMATSRSHHPGTADEEWSFAMPHWIDISFWSGPADVNVISPHQKSLRRMSSAPFDAQNTSFAPRCRMYELQMMGVMEYDMSNVSIPFLHENPLYSHTLAEHPAWRPHSRHAHFAASSSPSMITSGRSGQRVELSSTPESDGLKETSSELGALHTYRDTLRTWMEDYDEYVFLPLHEKQHMEESHKKARRVESAQIRRVMSMAHDPGLLGTSTNSDTPYLSRSVDSHPGSHFSQSWRSRTDGFAERFESRTEKVQARDFGRSSYATTPSNSRPPTQRRNKPLDSQVSRKESIASIASKPESSSTKSSFRPPKLMSLGIAGFEAPKDTASTQLSSNIAQHHPSDRDLGSASTASSRRGILDHVRASLSRKASYSSALTDSTEVADDQGSTSDTPSKPISIRSPSRAGQGAFPTIEEADPEKPPTRPVQDVHKAAHEGAPRRMHAHRSSTEEEPGPVLFSASKGLAARVGPRRDFASTDTREPPKTLSPTNALSPWLVIVNPSNPKKNEISVTSQFRRWQHVFPRPLRTSSIKWKSLCSPASVPLTHEYFPTADQLATEYNENPYTLDLNDDTDMSEAPPDRTALMRELVAFRLSQGFQFVIGKAVAEFAGRPPSEMGDVFNPNYMIQDGSMVFMSVGNTIHQLVCVGGGQVEVKRFSRKPTAALVSPAGVDTPLVYKPYIRTVLAKDYEPREVIFRPIKEEYNWTFIDQFLAGFHDQFQYSDYLRFWRARFVLIPVDIPSTAPGRSRPIVIEGDTPEEIRLEGIRKLTQAWQKHRYIPPEERQFQARRKKLDTNPLAIEFQTRDPSVIVAAGPESSSLADGEPPLQTALWDKEPYHTSKIDLKKLAQDLQGEKGIKMTDRRWHWRLHYNCFLGVDLTTWILQSFSDIETREEAVELGNQLMNKGLFQHVQKKHMFRDGNFFFQIASEYRAPRPESKSAGWLGTRRSDKSVPSTPLTGVYSDSGRSRSGSSSSSEAGARTPTGEKPERRKVKLSLLIRYDVDPRKRSYRPEIINLHYDRLHNPDNCYHIRIDWMNVTAKLIEDAIVSWSKDVEKYGLKLVEVPIAEASGIVEEHPFRAPYLIKLALPPPDSQPQQYFDSTSFSPRAPKDKHVYHKALLRKLNFVLDMESASSFPPNVEVMYSWGKPDYKYTQYIHRSGVLLAQITDEGDFLLLANRLYARVSPRSSPHVRASQVSTLSDTPTSRPVSLNTKRDEDNVAAGAKDSNFTSHKPPTPTPEQIKEEVEAFCHDKDALRQFYADAFRPRVSPSPHITPVLDSAIPSLGLPPTLGTATTGRESSPGPPSQGHGLPAPQLQPISLQDPGRGSYLGRNRSGSQGAKSPESL
ncbi:hypothetical protein BDY21DRAFT_339925 [Lineolata rhizophorae]|uniref:Vacuolar membrane-associated protein IML1 n=1 Tax=Lineolata rhizophorae TaxID=578093 RepID=A0A6A6P5Z4_9PEZI|nr:hypothetical protein BDY21DRAFT_339925 [Lineolata rhizophorae]